MSTSLSRGLSICLLVMAMARLGTAQSFVLHLPARSQGAEVSQEIGLTEITIKYHRPLAGGRKIWDGVVPYGKVWRTGANTITTISFTDPVMIEGKPLEKGTYGLHMIPTPDEWTVIFSKNSTSWGSFTYDQAEDALRITVKPQPAELHDALTYEFVQLQPESAVVELVWEKLAISFKVSVDVHSVVQASLKEQLRTLERYTWMSWNDAATYLLKENVSLDDALAYANKAISNEDRFEDEITKSKILTALNRKDEASATQKRALDLSTPEQADQLAHQMLAARRDEEAFAIFRDNARKHPDLWLTHEGLARMFSAQGKYADAEKEIKVALANAPQDQKNSLMEMAQHLGAKQDINKD